MKFGIFYELQLPRPWGPDSELNLYHNALDQLELADRLGYDFAWEVEHHFLEEYSHSSAPGVFLSAASQRTKQIRLGHGILQLTTNHPAKLAARMICIRVTTKFADDLKKSALTNAVATIRERINSRGVAEPTVVEKGDDIIVEEETIVRGCGFHGAVPGRARAATDLPDDAQPEAGNKAVQHRARRFGGAAHHNDHLRRLHRLMAERLQAGTQQFGLSIAQDNDAQFDQRVIPPVRCEKKSVSA